MQIHRGSAAELHGLVPDFSGRQAWVMEVDAPALVLGSTQTAELLDPTAVAAAGLDVVKRRSGGGAVLVDRDMLWVDLLIGRDDDLWRDDVGEAFGWVGDLWVDVLRSVGVDDAAVHTGALVAGEWGRTICFASLGPGEVRVGDAKVVGISQRRTRAGARFQCSVLCRPSEQSQSQLVDLFDLGPDDRAAARAALARHVAAVPVTRQEVLDSLADRLRDLGWERS